RARGPPPSSLGTRRLSSAVLYGHEGVPLVAALHGLLEHRANSAHVELVVEDTGLERRPLLGEQRLARGGGRRLHASREALDAVVILGLPPVVLLPPALPEAGVGRQVDPRLG